MSPLGIRLGSAHKDEHFPVERKSKYARNIFIAITVQRALIGIVDKRRMVLFINK